ncbi:hypothetical protein N9954_05685 [Maribacter sp.]|nr:hypothetical protein [Maribacter sp.]
MDVSHIHNIAKEIRWYLVFFSFSVLLACGRGDALTIAQIDYEDQKAVSVSFNTAMDLEELRIFIGEESQTSVIGVIVSAKDAHSFTPVVPFTPGQTYSFRKRDTMVLATFSIPKRELSAPNEVLGLYPQLDTVPENLLKMYLEFSQPMQEVGNALDFIKVTNETDSVETLPFLRLESELWNTEHTVLTLWLDPGRIKTDLIPNRELGLPLQAGKAYTLAIDRSWKSREGAPLKQAFSKKFHVGKRDDQKPELEKWKVALGQADSLKALHIDFGEPMDAFLALETIRLYDSNDSPISGDFALVQKQSRLRFIPNTAWPGKEIEIRVQSRLEDLAGNNLERRFDRPIKDGQIRDSDTTKVRSFKFRLPLKEAGIE